jgi:hypothetical protein
MAFGTLKADTLTHSTAGSLTTDYVVNGSAKAWNNTNNTGTTINDSFNIASLTDTGTGIQTHNVTNAFDSANHVPVFSVDNNINQQWTQSLTTTEWQTRVYTGSVYQDASIRTTSHGDLA